MQRVQVDAGGYRDQTDKGSRKIYRQRRLLVRDAICQDVVVDTS